MTSEWNLDRIQATLEALDQREGESEAQTLKRKRIVRAATDLFIHHGYRKTSVDDIARRAGIAKGTVYLYYKNKADLLVHALIEEKKQYLSRMEPLFDPALSARERLRMWFRLVLVVGAEMPLTSKLMSGDHEVTLVLEEMDADLRGQGEVQQTSMVAALLDEAASPHDWSESELLDRARALMGMLYAGMMTDERSRQGLSIECFATLMADMVVDGIAPSSATGTKTRGKPIEVESVV